MGELDDFLDSGATEQTEQVEAVEPQTERPRDENGRFAPKTETGVEPEPETEPDVPPTKDKLPQEEYHALKAIRDENKGLKSTLESLQQQLQQLQTPQQPPEPPPTIWDDEQGWQQHFGGQVAQQASFNARLDMSEMLAAQSHEDFDDMKAKFIEMMGQNPTLQQQALEAKHPWEKAYTIAKNAAKMEALGATDVADLEAKLREQIKAEMASQPTTPTLPNSLADQQSARQAGAQPFTPPSLDDILRR